MLLELKSEATSVSNGASASEFAPSSSVNMMEFDDKAAAATAVPPELDPDNPFKFCWKKLDCGHHCKGVKGESCCLPCIKPECIQAAIDFQNAIEEAITEEDEEAERNQSMILETNTRHSPCVLQSYNEN